MGVRWGRSLEGSGLVCSLFSSSVKPSPRPQHIMDGMREKETEPCLGRHKGHQKEQRRAGDERRARSGRLGTLKGKKDSWP